MKTLKKVMVIIAAIFALSISAYAEDTDYSVITDEAFTYYVYEDYAAVKSIAKDTSGEIIIPDEFEGKPITSILEYSFVRSSVESVILGENVKVIGKYAFSGVGTLCSVTLNEGLIEIGSYAFNYCSALTQIKLPSSIQSIKSYSFAHSGIESISIPSGISKIESNTFYACKELKSVILNENITEIGDNAFNHCSALTQIKLPSSVQSIKTYAFANSGLESVSIPYCIGKIEDYAFYNCKELATVELNEGLTEIGSQSFSNCSSLCGVSFPSSLQKIGTQAFAGCGLESITVPATISELGDYVFSSCKSLKEVKLGEGFEKLSRGIFNGCTSLTQIELPSTLKTIDSEAFRQSGLTSVKVPASVTNIDMYAFGYCESLEYAELQNGLKVIGSHAFAYTPLKEIVIPDSVENIGYEAFYNCQNLEKAVIGKSVKAIDSYAFYKTAITEIEIPSSISIIWNDAFSNCTNLSKVTFNEGVEHIYGSAFANTALEELILPDSLKQITSLAFADSKIKYLHLPDNDGVNIYDDSFKGCNDLEKIYIGTGVSKFTFLNAVNMDNVELEINPENTNLFIDEMGNIFSSDKTTWLYFNLPKDITSLEIPEGITTVHGVYGKYRNLTEIHFPSTVTSVGNSITGLLNLQVIYYGGTLNQWKSVLFGLANSSKIANIPVLALADGMVLENDIIYKKTENGYGVSSPNKLHITSEMTIAPEVGGVAVTDICDGAFNNIAVDSLTLPSGIVNIGENAFGDKIKDIYFDGSEEVRDRINESFSQYAPTVVHKTSCQDKAVKTNEIKASCFTTGEITKNCLLCGAGNSYTVNRLEHSYEIKIIEDMKTRTVLRTVCIHCGCFTEELIIRTYGNIEEIEYHDFTRKLEESPTCSSYGKVVHKCKDCSRQITVTLNKLPHYYGDEWITEKDATCKESGSKYRTCNNCDVKSKAVEIAPNPDNHLVATMSEVPATCTVSGYTAYNYCTVCNVLLTEKSIIPATGHTEIIDEEIAATCTEFGKSEGKHCSVCNEIISEQMPLQPTGHITDGGTITKSATCATSGTKTYKCKVCGAVTKTETIAATGKHTYKNIVVPATLSKNGSITPTCSVCKAKKTATVVYSPKTFKLSATSYAYDGKAKKPTVTVTDANGKVIANTNYSVAYNANTNIGTATITITFKGNYSGTKKITFKIVPAQATGLKASSVTTTSIKLSWTKVSGAKYYKVEQSTDGKTWKVITTTDKTTYIVSKLTASSKHQFRVTALDSTKKIAGKVSAALKTGTKTAAPVVTLASSKSKTATATWKKVAGASKYIVYKSTDNKNWTKVSETTKLTYDLTKLTGGKKIYVKVVAVNAYNQNSADSKVVSATVKK